jgi:hypothetical protein
MRGNEGVLAFYNSLGESVLWHSDDYLAVADWGICDETPLHQLAKGADLKAVGYEVEDDDQLYHVSSRHAFIWPDDSQARLIGENLYEARPVSRSKRWIRKKPSHRHGFERSTGSSWQSWRPNAGTASGSWRPYRREG